MQNLNGDTGEVYGCIGKGVVSTCVLEGRLYPKICVY